MLRTAFAIRAGSVPSEGLASSVWLVTGATGDQITRAQCSHRLRPAVMSRQTVRATQALLAKPAIRVCCVQPTRGALAATCLTIVQETRAPCKDLQPKKGARVLAATRDLKEGHASPVLRAAGAPRAISVNVPRTQPLPQPATTGQTVSVIRDGMVTMARSVSCVLRTRSAKAGTRSRAVPRTPPPRRTATVRRRALVILHGMVLKGQPARIARTVSGALEAGETCAPQMRGRVLEPQPLRIAHASPASRGPTVVPVRGAKRGGGAS